MLPRLLLTSLIFVLPIALTVPALAANKAQASQTDPELLESEAAFRFSAKLLDAKTVEVRFAIADGYYMYRDKFRFLADPGPASLGKADLPKGKVKVDPTFGKVETYRKTVTARLPVAGLPPDGKLSITVISQGCADAGVCYPPMTSKAALDLMPPASGKSLSSILNP